MRRIRNENRVGEREPLQVPVTTDDPQPLIEQEELVRLLARLGSLQAGPGLARPPSSATEHVGSDDVYVSLEGLIDVSAEIKRKKKELDKAQGFLRSIEAKLANEKFVGRAKPEVVERERERAEEARQKIARIEHAVEDLEAMA